MSTLFLALQGNSSHKIIAGVVPSVGLLVIIGLILILLSLHYRQNRAKLRKRSFVTCSNENVLRQVCG